MPFELDRVQSVEFGVCLDTEQGESYRIVPCEQGVQDALKEMLAATLVSLRENGTNMEEFSPAEKYGSTERLRLPLDSDLARKHQIVFASENLPTDTNGLEDPENLVSYFAVFRAPGGQKLMAFRRATQFKGVVRKHLVTLVNNALALFPDTVFKLDGDFDFLVLDGEILIWRPSGFMFTADIDGEVAACAMTNVDHISASIACVDFAGLRTFVERHKRAMRLVAAIKSRSDLTAISLERLKDSCEENGVAAVVENGKLVPAQGHEMEFLLLLDRRLYTTVLIEEQPETYQAASRSQVPRTAAGRG